MKTRLLSFLAIAFFSIPIILAQTTQTRDLGAFHSISVQSGIDLYLLQSDNQSVIVTANEDVIDKLKTTVEGGTLKIFFDRNQDGRGWKNGWNNGRLEVKVTSNELRKLSASGGSDVQNDGTWEGDEMQIISSGGSDIELDILVDRLMVQTSGGSDLEVTGSANYLNLQCSGGSDFKGRKLITKEAKIDSSGGSDAYVHVDEKLVVNASGSSDVHYSGDPKIKDINSSSSADVRKY